LSFKPKLQGIQTSKNALSERGNIERLARSPLGRERAIVSFPVPERGGQTLNTVLPFVVQINFHHQETGRPQFHLAAQLLKRLI
jgi:hypothetical protein